MRQNSLVTQRGSPAPLTAPRDGWDRFFNRWLSDQSGGPSLPCEDELALFVPRVDIKETDELIQVITDLPGLREEDIEIQLSDGLLTIVGKKTIDKDRRHNGRHRRERHYRAFHRVIPLPSQIETSRAEASLDNELLTITLPKAKETRSSVRVVPICGS